MKGSELMNRKTGPLKVSKTIAGLSAIMLLAACSSGASDASSSEEAAAPAAGEASNLNPSLITEGKFASKSISVM